MGIRILATGSFLPPGVITNDDFAARIDTSDEWIRKRTGIGERRFAVDQDTSDLALEAARIALERAGCNQEIKLVITASFTPDRIMPNISSYIVNQLGLPEGAFAFDVNMACTGFVGALRIAEGLLEPGQKALVLAAEVISKHLDPGDRSTLVLFGDGAGGVVLEKTAPKMHFDCGTLPGYENLTMMGGNLKELDHFLRMNGKEVFRFAATYVPITVNQTLRDYGLEADQVDHYVFHQANQRILDHVAKSLGIGVEKFYMNLDRYANTSAASIPLVLDEMNEKGLLKEKDLILLVGFGSGLSYCSTLIEW